MNPQQRPTGPKDKTGAFREINNRPIFWTDRDGITHRCEGADVHPGIRLLWTDCKRDVPADKAYLPGDWDGLTCPTCLAAGRDLIATAA